MCLVAPDPLLVREGSSVATCHRARHPVRKGSSVTTCPTTLDPSPGVEGLWYHHVRLGLLPGREGLRCLHMSHSSRPTSRCGRALASPRVLCHRACHPAGNGSGVTACPATPDPPPGVGGLWRHHVPCGSQPLRRIHVFPRRLTSDSSCPHQARGTGSALNAYKTSHT
jgi:hypothetical protein